MIDKTHIHPSAFIHGLDLSEMLWREAIQPILSRHFPGLVVSAGLLGAGSDVLGLDTPQSPDHDWGPRLMLFLSETDYPVYHEKIHAVLSQELPHEIHGYPIDMAYREAENSGDPAHHMVSIHTVRSFFQTVAKVDIDRELEPLDWVLIPQQQLLSVTAGRVFLDRLGQIEAARAKLAYYPHDVWLYLLAAQWMRISQEEHFMGRTGQAGDELGSRMVAARLVKDLMNLCFLMERRYAPYVKWFGTAFSRLDCSRALTPLFEQVFTAASWQERQAPLVSAYEIAAHMHNALGITEPLVEQASYFYNRPFLVIGGGRFYEAIRRQIRDAHVLALSEKLGGVDQFLDSTDSVNFLNENIEQIKKFLRETR